MLGPLQMQRIRKDKSVSMIGSFGHKLKVGSQVMVYFPNQVKEKAWEVFTPYFGLYKVHSLIPTNGGVQLWNCPDERSFYVALDQV